LFGGGGTSDNPTHSNSFMLQKTNVTRGGAAFLPPV